MGAFYATCAANLQAVFCKIVIACLAGADGAKRGSTFDIHFLLRLLFARLLDLFLLLRSPVAALRIERRVCRRTRPALALGILFHAVFFITRHGGDCSTS